MSRISRKEFLRLAAMAAASGVLPTRARADGGEGAEGSPDADEPPTTAGSPTAAGSSTADGSPAADGSPDADVIVIGAGLAGLSTARNLVRLGVDKVLVLEARPRVGGRTVNLSIPGGHVVEGGGEWIGPGQDAIAALADELGVATFPAFYRGDTTYDLRGAISRGFLPELDAKQGYDFIKTATKLDRLCRQLPEGHPWNAPDAAAWDGMTLADWLEGEASTGFTHDIFRLITRALMAGYPERISLLWFLWYLRSAGGILPLILNDGGAQDLRFEGGSQLVSTTMAEQLGDRVRLGQPVLGIRDEPGKPVEVRTRAGVLQSERVVVAMMPADLGRIAFEPGLPAQRQRLVNGWARLCRLPIVKLSVIYETPFWRSAGLNGAMQSDRSPLQLIFDNSPPDGSIGVLSCFLSVVEAPEFADRAQRERRVVDELVRYFGPEAKKTVAYVEKDWATDPWSTGCITPLTPGLLTDAGPCIREPVGRIHWAGTETAVHWSGFMDGAVRSGERAAGGVRGRCLATSRLVTAAAESGTRSPCAACAFAGHRTAVLPPGRPTLVRPRPTRPAPWRRRALAGPSRRRGAGTRPARCPPGACRSQTEPSTCRRMDASWARRTPA